MNTVKSKGGHKTLKYKINKNRRLLGSRFRLKSKKGKNKFRNLLKSKYIKKSNLKGGKRRKLRRKELKKSFKKNMKGGFIKLPFVGGNKNSKEKVLIDAMCSQIDDEFNNNPRKIDGFIKSLCPQYQDQTLAQPQQSRGIIGGALNMLNPSNNGMFGAIKSIGNVVTSPIQKIMASVSATATQNPIGQQLQNMTQQPSQIQQPNQIQQLDQIQPIQNQQQVNKHSQEIYSGHGPIKKKSLKKKITKDSQMAGSKLSLKKNYTEPIMKIKIQ
jgi:hypothetical protein